MRQIGGLVAPVPQYFEWRHLSHGEAIYEKHKFCPAFLVGSVNRREGAPEPNVCREFGPTVRHRAGIISHQYQEETIWNKSPEPVRHGPHTHRVSPYLDNQQVCTEKASEDKRPPHEDHLRKYSVAFPIL